MAEVTFKKIKEEQFPLLEQYTPVLYKVHGKNHPELKQVRDIFAGMNTKVQNSDDEDLSPDFNELREVTSNYKIPSDGCETYTATYEMLENADKAYHAS